jgi:hypothetical protein
LEFAVLFSTKRQVVILVLVLGPLVQAGPAHAQTTASQQRLSALQQQNAYQQQQTAIQLAVQQTNVLVQTALRQGEAPQESSLFRSPSFQQQQVALRAALQKTAALQQVMLRANRAPRPTALAQISALQSVLQTSLSLQTATQIQNGPLAPTQIQTLFRKHAERPHSNSAAHRLARGFTLAIPSTFLRQPQCALKRQVDGLLDFPVRHTCTKARMRMGMPVDVWGSR